MSYPPLTRRGFSLLEVIVVIAVISILASMAVPYASKVIDQSRTEATRKEMEEIYRAIVGDPLTGTAGYVGDMGRLPTNLVQLNTQAGPPVQPNPVLNPPLGVNIGWRGPYINTGYDLAGYLNDGWGTAYTYGVPGAGQIRSAGPDRIFGTADDTTYPPNAAIIQGSLLVNLLVWDSTAGVFVTNPGPGAYPGMTVTVSLYYSNTGAQAVANISTAPGPYTFANYHSGNHAVLATCTLPPRPAVTGQAVVLLPGNNQQTTLNLYLR